MALIGGTNVHEAGRPILIHFLNLSISLKLNVWDRQSLKRPSVSIQTHGWQFKTLLIVLLEPQIFEVFFFIFRGDEFLPVILMSF